jgi:SAM-dependent methyltransferase
VIEYLLDSQRAFAARSRPFDEERVRELAGRVFDRSNNIESSMTNHRVIAGGMPWRHRLGEIRARTVVIHGTEDPLLPYAHALALSHEITDAELLALEHTGHELPRAVWDTVIPAILRHTSGGWEQQADRLAAKALAAEDPTGWFERLYSAADAGEVATPWDREQPNTLLVEWAQVRKPPADGRQALVVGCGLGADAQYLARLGFETTAFDIAATAIDNARRRYPDSAVHYLVADLLHPPVEWERAFDLVVEVNTVQALPEPQRRAAIANVARTVAPDGTLIVIAAARGDLATPGTGPPWPLTRAEIEAFCVHGLTPVRIEHLQDRPEPAIARWRAEFAHP